MRFAIGHLELRTGRNLGWPRTRYCRLGRRDLRRSGNVRCPLRHCGQRSFPRRVSSTVSFHVGQFRGTSLALQPQVLSRHRVEVLLPQTSRRGVWRSLIDGLAVVLGEQRVTRYCHFPALKGCGDLGSLKVVPPDNDVGRARLNRRESRHRWHEVTLFVEALEVRDSGSNIAQRAAFCNGRRPHASERCAGRQGTVVEAYLVT